MHVVFVFPDANLGDFGVAKHIFQQGVSWSAAANGILLLTIAMAIFTCAEVTFESMNMDYFSRLTYSRYCVKCIVALK